MKQFNVLQEHSQTVANLASSFNIPKDKIVFDAKGCPFYQIRVCINSDDNVYLEEFLKNVKPYCI